MAAGRREYQDPLRRNGSDVRTSLSPLRSPSFQLLPADPINTLHTSPAGQQQCIGQKLVAHLSLNQIK